MDFKDLRVSAILATSGYILLNKKLVKKIGLELAYLYSELANEEKYWFDKNELTPDGYFFSTSDNIENALGINRQKQWQLLNKLKELNLINTEIRGMPGKRFVKLKPETLLHILN